MSVDLSETIAAKSDQLNADDLLAGPMTGRVVSVSKGSTAEQPISIGLDCWPQPYRPCKTMRRILVTAWGPKGDEYIGRSITLYRDQSVKWGGESVGGIRIKAMSHLDKPLEVSLAETRKTKKKHVIEVLKRANDSTAFEAMKSKWKSATVNPTADAFREWVSEVTAGRVGMSDANIPSKYTPELLAMCDAAIDRISQ